MVSTSEAWGRMGSVEWLTDGDTDGLSKCLHARNIQAGRVGVTGQRSQFMAVASSYVS
jgi:hypothetical protein